MILNCFKIKYLNKKTQYAVIFIENLFEQFYEICVGSAKKDYLLLYLFHMVPC